MPQIAISVNGQIIVLPGAYVQTNVTPTVPSGQLPTGPLVFIATGYGGVPFTPYNFTDGNALLAAMRGAPSNDLVNFMFDPSSELNGTSFVTYINVSPNTPSSATIVNSGSTAVINLTSLDYGTPSNLVTYAIGAGSTAGTVAMTLTDGFSTTSFTGDDLGIPFQVSYVGSASGVTYSVASTLAGRATHFNITSPHVGESVSLDLTSSTYAQVSNIVQYLNGTGFYNAIVVNNGLLPSYYLDVISGVSLVANTSVNVTATLGDIVYWINTVGQSIASAVITPGITSSVANQPALIALQFFAGATNGVPSLSDYASGFNVALNQPAWVVLADNNTAAVRNLGAQHVAAASSIVQGKWRRFLTGSALTETAATAEANAIALNQLNVSYCWPGLKRVNVLTNINTTYDGLHTAAAVAGMMTGNAVVTPVTHKTLLGTGVERTTDLATKKALMESGVLVLDYPTDTRIPTLLADVTTWQNDNTAGNIFNQQISCRYALSYSIVRALTPYVGNVASNFDIVRAKNAVKTLLNSQIYNGQNNGILNGWDPNTLVLTYDGTTQTLFVNVAVVFVGQNLYIVVNVTVNPLNIQINAQGVVTNG